MQIRINAENAAVVGPLTVSQNRSAAYIVNDVLKKARKAGILVAPKKTKKS